MKKELRHSAYHGFIREDGLILNPSYRIFPVFATLAEYRDASLWRTISRDALTLLKGHAFCDFDLPPDWFLLSKNGGAEVPL